MNNSSVRPRKRSAKRIDTKQRILDAAEILMAQHGYHATSLRTVTRTAKVNLAAVHYHFGSKQALLEAVISRRLSPLNAERRARLVALPAETETSAILRAFLEPVFALLGASAGARHFLTLVGRAMVEPDESVRSVFLAQMHEVLEQLFERLDRSLPRLPAQEAYWRLFFALGTVAHTLRMADKCRQLPPGVTAEIAPGELLDKLLAFIVAGMMRPAQEDGI